MPVRIEAHNDGVVISVKVVPGASRDRIVGELGDALKIAVSKPPQDGAANRAVIALIADILDVPSRNLSVVSGHTSPRKQIRITGLSAQEVAAKLGI